MQINTNGQRNITLDFDAPKKFKLRKDGAEVPYIRTGKNSFRLGRNIDGVLDLEEVIEQPRIVKPMQLQAQQMALVNPNDVLMINQAAQQLEVEQNILSETQKRVEQTQAYLDVQQQKINEAVLSVQGLETDNSERITATENGIFNLAGELAKAEGNSADADNYIISELDEHKTAKNPHGITKETIGLNKVDNTSDLDKPISKAVQGALDEKADKDEIQAIRDELGEYQEKNDRFTNALSNYTGGLAGNQLPDGGSQGQILAKRSDMSGDAEWVDSSASITIDDELSLESKNPVQNKVITLAVNNISDEITAIESKIPAQASISNQLADKDFVNSLQTSKQDVLTSANAGNCINIAMGGSSGLPAEYQEVEYLQSSGTQYIITDVYLSGDDYEFFIEYDTSNITSKCLFGVQPRNALFVLYNGSIYNQPTSTIPTNRIRNGVFSTGRHTLTIKTNNGTVEYKTDDSTATSYSLGTTTAFDATLFNEYPVGLFGYLLNGSVNTDRILSGKIYRFYIKQNGSLVFNAIPAKDSNNVLGMYDTVTSNFFTNAGTGTFIAGENVEETTKISFVNDAGYITNSALSGYATESYVTTAVSGKQDTLVSGANIKTINNQSILGSGNIDIQGGGSYTAGTGIDITNDVISVTSAISTGAALGATALQPSALNGYATQAWVGQQGYITGITSSDVTTALGYTPYNASNPNGYITSSALTPYVLSADLATVATSGSYNDLSNKPTIPTVNNPTITFTQGGTTKGTITLNQSTNQTVALDSGGSARNIGEIVESTIPLTDAGLHLLDGSLIQGNGIYSEFYDFMVGIHNKYPQLFCTEEQWQQYVAADGACSRFVLNTTNKTVRLGLITGFIEGTNSLSDLGALTAAGLPIPNISMPTTGSGDNNSQWHKATLMNDGGSLSRGGLDNDNWVIQTLNANNSTIYGNSNTVQPQSIKVLYYIVIATSTKTDIQVDIDEIATDLNGKADKSSFQVVSALPANPDVNTFYFIPE